MKSLSLLAGRVVVVYRFYCMAFYHSQTRHHVIICLILCDIEYFLWNKNCNGVNLKLLVLLNADDTVFLEQIK